MRYRNGWGNIEASWDCSNYHDVKEIEKELKFNATETQMETPNGMSASSKDSIAYAFWQFRSIRRE